MLAVFLKKYRTMLLCSLFSFYFGCFVSLSLLKLDCADGTKPVTVESDEFMNVEFGVLILSAPDNKIRRNAIRDTWIKLSSNLFYENGERLYDWKITRNEGAVQHDFVKFYFVVAIQGLAVDKFLELSAENTQYNDLLFLSDLEDNYKNLSEKMLKSFKWFSENMKHLKYLIKCDDDSFVRIDLIIKDLDTFAPDFNAPEISDYVTFKKSQATSKGLYWGYFNGRARVYLSGKWHEEEWFLCDHYLPYTLGGGYVLSGTIVDYIAKNADILSKYHSEDVSLGVWTSPLDSIKRVHDTRFDTEWKSRGCSNNMLVRHKQTPEDMNRMFQNLLQSRGKRLCNSESVARKTYSYKWDVLPSACCR